MVSANSPSTTWNEPPALPGATVNTPLPEEAPPQVIAEPETPSVTVTVAQEDKTSKWKVFPQVHISTSADDNIYIDNNRKEGDVYFTIAPSLAAGWGDYKDQVTPLDETDHVYHISLEEMGVEKNNFLYAQYTPSWVQFVNHSSENSLNHDIILNSAWQLRRLSFGLNIHYQSLDTEDVDVGARVHRDVLTAALDAHYAVSEKTSLDVKLAESNRAYRQQLTSNEVTESTWLGYAIMPKTNIGIGASFGYVNVENESGQTYERVEAGATWVPTGKISVRLTGGVEYRQTNSTAGDRLGGIFGFGASYQPFDGTDIGIDASRETQNSAVITDANYTATSVSLRLKQRLFQRFHATLMGGYTDSLYDKVVGDSTQRHDDYFFTQAGLSFDFTKWSNIEVDYQYRQNHSTRFGSTFDQNVANLNINLWY